MKVYIKQRGTCLHPVAKGLRPTEKWQPKLFNFFTPSSAPIITSRAIRCEMATRGTWISWIANEWKL
jgi:hypothetical protein